LSSLAQSSWIDELFTSEAHGLTHFKQDDCYLISKAIVATSSLTLSTYCLVWLLMCISSIDTSRLDVVERFGSQVLDVGHIWLPGAGENARDSLERYKQSHKIDQTTLNMAC
jgi:hypothetical protein